MTRIKLDDFDLNTADVWATFAEGRSPQLKMHAKRSTALNACSTARSNFILFRLKDGNWEEIWRVKYKEHLECPHKDQVATTAWGTAKIYVTGRWVDLDTDRPRFVFICHDCYNQNKARHGLLILQKQTVVP